ncbi:MAG: DUF6266 family protein [Flavobacteriaceae bacterium]
MAILKSNPFGPMSGKLGGMNLKHYKKSNQQRLTNNPDMSGVKASKLQKIQRNKMSMAMAFLSPLSGLIKVAYRPFRKEREGFDVAKSYFMKEVLFPVEEGYDIDYGKVLVTFGDLRIPEGILIDVDEDSERLDIALSWEDNTHQAMAYPDDSLLLVIRDAEDNRFIYFKNITTRDALTGSVSLQSSYKTKKLHLWMAFVRPEEKRASASVYLGVLNG